MAFPFHLRSSALPQRGCHRVRVGVRSRPLLAANLLEAGDTTPATAAVRLNFGATPTPRRAKPPARLGRDRWWRASGSARSSGDTRGRRAGGPLGGAHQAGTAWKKRPTAFPRLVSGTATPPRALASNRCQREGQPCSRSTETIKGPAGKAVGYSFRPPSDQAKCGVAE